VSLRPFPVRLLFTAILASAILVTLACSPGSPQSTFDPAGPVARDQKTLFLVIFWAAVAIFVAVEVTLLYTLVRNRRRPGRDLPKQVHGNLKLEIVWTIAPVIVLVILAVPTINLILELGTTPDKCKDQPAIEECLLVNAIGHQWWWEFEYPQLGLVTANELHISAGTTVSINLKSADVLHSFWVPKLAGKIDMVPGKVNALWLESDEPGTFFGQCAELCGISHANMRLRVIAHPNLSAGIPADTCYRDPCPLEDFNEWASNQLLNGEQPVSNTSQKKGEELFAAKQCFVCHTIRGNPLAIGKIGPDLTHLASRDTLAAGMLDNDDEGEGLRRWLRDPEEIKPGNIMSRDAEAYLNPALMMTRADIEELVAYLKSLK
jgi:cytochrome c oxidase subunit 2